MIRTIKQKTQSITLGIVLAVSLLAGSGFAALSSPNIVAAAPATPAAPTQRTQAQGADNSCVKGSIVTFPAWYSNLCSRSNPGAIASPSDVGGIGKFILIIAINIATMLIYLVGFVSLAFVIWGGFKYIINGDNANGTAAARKTILNAVIGMVLSIMSVAIVKAIAGAVTK
jgi:hypothetical protein